MNDNPAGLGTRDLKKRIRAVEAVLRVPGSKNLIPSAAPRDELSNIIGTPTEGELEEIEPTLVTETLRKVPQALTPKEQKQVKANLNISKMELFCDLFSAAAGNAGYARMVNGVFDGMLNGLPVTYEEAITIYYETVIRPYPRGVFEYSVSKTLLPLHMPYEQTAKSLFENCLNLEIIGPTSLSNFSPTNITRTFAGCVKLRRVEALTYFGTVSGGDTCFQNCMNLEFVNFGYLRCNLDLHWSPKLTLEMMNKMVASNRLLPNTGVVFTVHPDVYAKLTDETNTEWHQVLIDAAAKNITFATV